MKGFTVFGTLLVVAIGEEDTLVYMVGYNGFSFTASIDLVSCGGDSFPSKPVTAQTSFEEFTMPIEFEITEKVPDTASGRPCPACLPGRNAQPFEQWAAKHLERPGPANGICAANREKVIFIGEPDKCCCEPVASP
ncbi:unnamed protein product [Diamesa serratosioi]